MDSDINEVTEKVKEYAELSKTIKIIQEKLKILNKKKKELYKDVIPKLKTNNVTKCNLSFGTLKVLTTKRKIQPTKCSIKDRYISFYNTIGKEEAFVKGTPQEKALIIYNYIYVENLEIKEAQSISMVYNKDFKQQLKGMSV